MTLLLPLSLSLSISAPIPLWQYNLLGAPNARPSHLGPRIGRVPTHLDRSRRTDLGRQCRAVPPVPLGDPSAKHPQVAEGWNCEIQRTPAVGFERLSLWQKLKI